MSNLLDRCCDAYQDGSVLSEWPDEKGMAAALRTIAAEILEHHHRSGARAIAQLLLEAADQDPDTDDDSEPPETWHSHPSLTVEQRNPNLR